MIINIRGTSGSGKSTLARFVIEHFGAEPVFQNGKIIGYLLAPEIYVVGRYTNPCGGCDTIKTQDEVVAQVLYGNSQARNVLFEGAIVSTITGRYLQMAEAFRGKFIFAILDTPLETCLERIKQRRAAKGNTKPLDPTTTIQKHRTIMKFAEQYSGSSGYDVRWLDHRHALEQLLEMMDFPQGWQ